MAELRTSLESVSSASSEEEKSIYENLMEIFPLMEDFMNKQGSVRRAAFGHQAPLTFTRAPARQAPEEKRLELRDRSEALKPPNVPLAQDLQRELDEVRNRLRETESQSTSVTKELQTSLEMKDTRIGEMEFVVTSLHREIQRKEKMANSAEKELAETKDEIAKMRWAMEKARSNIFNTNSKAADYEQELLGVQVELSALHSQVVADDQRLSDSPLTLFHDTSSNLNSIGQEQPQSYRRNREMMERARRAYQAAVIVARESNQESALVLCAVLRFQLQAFVSKSAPF